MSLYPYQERVKTLIQNGHSVILQAPTGSGKTRAALDAFIEAFFDFPVEVFPRKCIYTVPMRVLANQFVMEYQNLAASYKRRHHREIQVSIQTGDQPEDKHFDQGNLIFCTIDQFLSSYLTMPYSLPGRLANLNAGAMVGSYLVFDEFHLLDPGSTLPTVLYTLRQLRQISPVLLMTATFSTNMLGALAKELDAEVVLVPPEEAHGIETKQGIETPRQRLWHTASTIISTESILALHNRRSIALCNTVQRAQMLYRNLRTAICDHDLGIEVRLLHSRFLPQDRREIESEMKRLFGKEADRSGSFILVATQTIEVGVDITSEVLHTELAPASALIQRAGRCARFPGEEGQVIVYPVESFKPYGNARSRPEEEEPWVGEMRTAFEWLQRHNGEVFDFQKEQAFVDEVATPRDRKILMGLSSGRIERAERIHQVLRGERQGDDQRLLVREADSRLVLIHANPDTLLTNPLAADGFNLPISTLYGFLKQWWEREIDTEWRIKYLQPDITDSHENNRTDYGWLPLRDPSQLAISQAIVVHPALAGYLKDEGFVADQGNTGFESSLSRDLAMMVWDGYSYRLESYEDHILRVLQAFQEVVLPELHFPSIALERVANWPVGSLLVAGWIICLLHDVGKLQVDWQTWARAYQERIGKPVPPGFAVAHTDYERGNHLHQEAEKIIRKKYPKPNHAGEGTLAVSRIVASALSQKELAKAALTAMTRHHTPFASKCGTFTLIPGAKEHIQAMIKVTPKEVREKLNVRLLKNEVAIHPNSFSNLLIGSRNLFGWLAYLLLVRALRRADQEGTAKRTR